MLAIVRPTSRDVWFIQHAIITVYLPVTDVCNSDLVTSSATVNPIGSVMNGQDAAIEHDNQQTQGLLIYLFTSRMLFDSFTTH